MVNINNRWFYKFLLSCCSVLSIVNSEAIANSHYCSNELCSSNGVCHKIENKNSNELDYYCVCTAGFSGENCQIEDAEDSNLNKRFKSSDSNVETIYDPFNAFIVDINGIAINEQCDSSICSDQGVCYTNPDKNSTYCACFKPYTGEYCENTPTCLKELSLCKYGNITLNENGQMECICPYGKYGVDCESELICDDSTISCNDMVYSNSCLVNTIVNCHCCSDGTCLVGPTSQAAKRSNPCYSATCLKMSYLTDRVLSDLILPIVYNIATNILDMVKHVSQLNDKVSILENAFDVMSNIISMPSKVNSKAYLNRIKSYLSILDLLLSSSQYEFEVAQQQFSTATKLTSFTESYFTTLNYENLFMKYTFTNVDFINVNNIINGYNGFIKVIDSDDINTYYDVSEINYETLQTSAFLNTHALNITTDDLLPARFSFTLYKNANVFVVGKTKDSLARQAISDDYNDYSTYEDPIFTKDPGVIIDINYDNEDTTPVLTIPAPTEYRLECNSVVISDVVSIVSDTSYTGNGLIVSNFKAYQLLNVQDECKQMKMVPKCVFWNYSINDWDTQGCRYEPAKSGVHRCICDHMTHFAVIMTFENKTEDSICTVCDDILNYVSYIGTSVSILGLIITIILFIGQLDCCKRSNRNDSYHSMSNIYIRILITVCASLLVLNGLFLAFSFLKWNDNLKGCMVIGVMMHYSLLSSFCWMICLGVIQYFIYIQVFTTFPKFYLFSCFFSFVIPLIPIVIILSINWKLYLHKSYYCWVSGYAHIFSVILFISIAIFINTVIMALLVKHHSKCFRKTSNNKSSNNSGVQSSVTNETMKRRQTAIFGTCSVNMGLTWIFGIIVAIPTDTYTNIVFSYLFCIFNAFQGFLIFVSYNIFIKTRRDQSKKLLSKAISSVKGAIRSKSVTIEKSKPSLETRTSTDSNTSRTTEEIYLQ